MIQIKFSKRDLYTALATTAIKSGGYASGTTSSTSTGTLTKTVSIWGNSFDGTNDVDGDIIFPDDKSSILIDTYEQKHEADDDVDTWQEMTITSDKVIIKDEAEVNGNLYVTNNIKSDNTINGNVLEARTQLKTNKISEYSKGSGVTVDSKLFTTEIKNSGRIVTEDLEVTGNAHFFNLVVDEVKAVGGRLIISPADCVVDGVVDFFSNNANHAFAGIDLTDEQLESIYNEIIYYPSQFSSLGFDFNKICPNLASSLESKGLTKPKAVACIRVFQLAQDEDDVLTDTWEVGDQAYLQKFNVGHLYDIEKGNINSGEKGYTIGGDAKKWWSGVVKVGHSNYMLNGVETRFNWFDVIAYFALDIRTETIDGEEYNVWTTICPEGMAYSGINIGDNIVQLGNRTKTDRQNAIVISSYNDAWLDTDILAPCIVQYKGINEFSLSGHEMNIMSASGNIFRGKFVADGTNGFVNSDGSSVGSHSPYIGEDGYWYVWSDVQNKYVNSGIKAEGQSGISRGINVQYSADATNWHNDYDSENDEYMRFGVEQEDGSISWGNAIKIVGKDGTNGKSYEGTTEHYIATTTETKPSYTDNWKSTIAETGYSKDKPYLWNYETVSIKDANGTTTSTNTSIELLTYFGKDGRTVSYIRELYVATTTDTAPNITINENFTYSTYAPEFYSNSKDAGFGKDKPYLWNIEVLFDEDKNYITNTGWQLISHWGQDGDGKDGEDAIVLIANKETFKLKENKKDAIIDLEYDLSNIDPDGTKYSVSMFKVAVNGSVSAPVTLNEDDPNTKRYYNATITDWYDGYIKRPQATPVQLKITIETKATPKVVKYTKFINIEINPGAYFEVAENIRSLVSDNEGRISAVEETAESLTSQISDFNYSEYSTLKQTVDGFDLATFKENMETAGIHLDGANSCINAVANKFVLKDTSGNAVISTDTNGTKFKGIIEATGGTFKNDDGTWKIELDLDDKSIEIDGPQKLKEDETAIIIPALPINNLVKIGHSETAGFAGTASDGTKYHSHGGEIELISPIINSGTGMNQGFRKMRISAAEGIKIWDKATDTNPSLWIDNTGVITGSLKLVDVPVVFTDDDGKIDFNHASATATELSQNKYAYKDLASGTVYKIPSPQTGGYMLMIK